MIYIAANDNIGGMFHFIWITLTKKGLGDDYLWGPFVEGGLNPRP